MDLRLLATLALATTLNSLAAAQSTHNEIEPNESKAQGTVTPCLVSGDMLTGTSTGALLSPGASSADTFRVRSCAGPAGIYMHQFVLSSSTPGHTGTLRGLTQSLGVISPASDVQFQVTTTSSTPNTPPRTSRWYGFGRSEEIYYRVAGTSTTTSPYLATYTSATVLPVVVPGSFLAGPITIDSGVPGHSTDTDLWLFDGTHTAIANAGNDEPGVPPITGRPAALTRTLSPGTYTVAISNYNLATNLPSATDDVSRSDNVLDFPDSVACSGAGAPLDVSFVIFDGVQTVPVTVSKTMGFEVVFATFTVAAGPAFSAFCTNGSLGADHTTLCPCGNVGDPGNGCAHSFSNTGGRLTASGSAPADDVRLAASLLPSTSFTLFMQHDALADAVFHDGVLCAGGTLIRLRGRQAGIAGQPGPGQATFPNTNFANDTQSLSQRGGVTVGSGLRRYYAAWYRNASTTFCPPATANVTNGFVIDW